MQYTHISENTQENAKRPIKKLAENVLTKEHRLEFWMLISHLKGKDLLERGNR